MRTKLVTAPVELPLTLEQVRVHLKASNTVEDGLLMLWLTGAVEHAETFTERRFITQTWDAFADCFPGDEFELPNAPLVSVTSVKYIDDAGVEQTLDPSQYQVDAKRELGRIRRAYGVSWPSTRPETLNAVTVRFVCGYGLAAATPYMVKAALALLVQWHEGRRAEEAIRVAAESLLEPYRVIR